MIEAGKRTGEARWGRRRGMRSHLLAAVTSFEEGMERSRWFCAWGIQAWDF